MATIITKNSQTPGAVPSAASLTTGELAVNTADARLYTEHSDGSVREIIPSTVRDGGITTAKIADGNVTGAKLENSGVTAGTYTTATVTVDSKGRITSASSGSGGGGQLRYEIIASSTTWVCPANVTRVFVRIYGAGSGTCFHTGTLIGVPGVSGGIGTGYYTVVPGTSYTVTIGAGGTNSSTSGTGTATSTGGTTSFGSFITLTGAVRTLVNGDTQGGNNGTLTGGTFGLSTATQTLSGTIDPFYGSTARPANAGNTPLTWSASSGFVPGAAGSHLNNGTNTGSAGVGGAILLIYVG